VINLKSTFGDF